MFAEKARIKRFSEFSVAKMRDFPLLHLFLSFVKKGENKTFWKENLSPRKVFLFHFVVTVRPKTKSFGVKRKLILNNVRYASVHSKFIENSFVS